jgi:hypothetical protein
MILSTTIHTNSTNCKQYVTISTIIAAEICLYKTEQFYSTGYREGGRDVATFSMENNRQDYSMCRPRRGCKLDKWNTDFVSNKS